MPSPTDPSTARGTREAPGGLSTGALAGLGVVLIVAVGALFYLARAPLAEALGLAAIESARGVEVAPEADTTRTAATEPDRPPTADGSQVRAVDPQWNLLRVQTAVKTGGEALEARIAEGRAELAELDDWGKEGSGDEGVSADRAKRRFATWGRSWINRLRALAGELPSEEACAVHASMDPKCRELRLALAEAAQATRAPSLDAASERLDDAAARVDTMLRPPLPDDEPEDEDTEDVDAGQ